MQFDAHNVQLSDNRIALHLETTVRSMCIIMQMESTQLLQTEAHRQRLEAVRAARAKSRAKARAAETYEARQKRLDVAKAYRAKSKAAFLSYATVTCGPTVFVTLSINFCCHINRPMLKAFNRRCIGILSENRLQA